MVPENEIIFGQLSLCTLSAKATLPWALGWQLTTMSCLREATIRKMSWYIFKWDFSDKKKNTICRLRSSLPICGFEIFKDSIIIRDCGRGSTRREIVEKFFPNLGSWFAKRDSSWPNQVASNTPPESRICLIYFEGGLILVTLEIDPQGLKNLPRRTGQHHF